MDREFWLERWKQKETKFHRAEFHPYLTHYFKTLRPGRVLVPLCGKSLDLEWLRRAGHQVVGIELSEIAAADFFRENGLPVTIRNEGAFKVFAGERIEIWCGDFFAFEKGGFGSFYDRAALVALPPPMRLRYAAHLEKLIAPQVPVDFRGLVITFEYPQERAEGPPFAVQRAEVEQLFSPFLSVTHLVRKADPDLSSNPRFVGIPDVAESAYELLNRPK